MRSDEIERHKAMLKPGAEQKAIIVGILLGDATLETQNSGRTYRMKVEHGMGQQRYVEHLYDVFKEWVLTEPRIRNVRLRNGKTYESMVFSTVSHASLRFYAQQFYRDGVKVVPKLIHRWLTPRALAYWFMDDGSIKSKQSKGVIFNTQGYSKQDVSRLIRTLQSLYHLEAKERRQKEGLQIYVSGKSYGKFKDITWPYILPEMRYKIPEARRTQLPKL